MSIVNEAMKRLKLKEQQHTCSRGVRGGGGSLFRDKVCMNLKENVHKIKIIVAVAL